MDNYKNLEIERKFLIAYPDVQQMKVMDGYNKTEIVQTYIRNKENGKAGRVRRRGNDGSYVYTETYKQKVTAITRVEEETEISPKRYMELMHMIRPGTGTIVKNRHCFRFAGLLYEIDVYPFWDDRAVMEVELTDENQQIPIPACIKVMKEVTDDPRYRNKALSKKIVFEEI